MLGVPSGCFTTDHAFYARYSLDPTGGNVVQKHIRVFPEVIIIDGPNVLNKVLVVKYEFSTKTSANDMYSIAMSIIDPKDSSQKGIMIMFFNKADDSLLSTSVSYDTNINPITKLSYLARSGSVVNFAYVLGYESLKNGVKSSTSIDTKRINFKYDTSNGQIDFETLKF